MFVLIGKCRLDQDRKEKKGPKRIEQRDSACSFSKYYSCLTSAQTPSCPESPVVTLIFSRTRIRE
ncbi:hypothetical protein BCR41DRAFT_344227 [Lobosporangium transversale]|uniref:Uncharacterized protein n=1 Tax=Lobosporangium transversale TaxID=64571 RepID=A0A1Y2H2T8_9FUNG|nr:hypothetical protein BCR41DRAFT_344227 [Lobosporangium transversale]ORZ28880.1 hypothetical protein BCR41DRAFT_344227 [Lobosporangium transversale]|eukprot:XP_021886553.1 hypothetical protein BCR41DRAFT_344227 [Lobosporangium transversale]